MWLDSDWRDGVSRRLQSTVSLALSAADSKLRESGGDACGLAACVSLFKCIVLRCGASIVAPADASSMVATGLTVLLDEFAW